MPHFHAVVWIDHKEARIFHFNAEDTDKLTLRSHHKAKVSTGRADEHFLHKVVKALSDAGEILITGPAGAKTELFRHISRHDAPLLSRVISVESSDHPTDGQIVAHARRYFETKDRTTAQKPV